MTVRKNEERLGNQKVSRLVFTLALPSIVAQVVNLLYNLVDRIYIGHMPVEGPLALTSLGLCSPVVMLLAAFSLFAGNGGAPFASMELGKNNRGQANTIMGNALFMLLCFSLLLTTVILAVRRPLLYFFGASEVTIGYAEDYLFIYTLGTTAVLLTMGLNPYITCQGQPVTAMLSTVIGAVLNIVLDPLFIYKLHMGVRGAALATVLSQCVSAVWVVSFLLSEKSSLRISRRKIRPDPAVIKKISALGFSPFIMRTTESLIAVVFTSGLSKYGGDLYVSAYSVMQSAMQVKSVAVQGFAYGAQPAVSYNFGSGNFARVKSAIKIIILFCFSFTVAYWLFCELCPGFFAKLFTDDAELIALVKKIMPLYMGGMWCFGIHISCQANFIGLGEAKKSAFISCLRKVILLAPLGLLLPLFFGVNGLFIAECVADTVTPVVGGAMFWQHCRKSFPTDTSRISKGDTV